MRIGQGWDIHRLEEGRSLIIGGTVIPSKTGAIAHSDGDVLAHAIIDAILGAVAAGDIGSHFPDTSKAWQGADSMKLLAEAIAVAAEAGFKPVNIDSTIILQTPKLRPFIHLMRNRIAAAAGISVNDVSVKAKTNEGIGDIGAGKAVEAQAVVLMKDIE